MAQRSDLTPTDLMPALQSHRWFASCAPAFQEALVSRARLVYLKQGESFFTRGGAPDAMCCVLAGALKLGSMNPVDGSPRLMYYAEPYHWFGEVGLIDQLPRIQDAVAETASTILVVSRALIEPWLDAHPQHWRDLARLACSKFRLMAAALEDHASLTHEQQLARRLLFTANNLGQASEGMTRRRVRLSQTHLAQMLGLSRQTVNRLLRGMERDGLLNLRYAEIEVLDMKALLERAGPLDQTLLRAMDRPVGHKRLP